MDKRQKELSQAVVPAGPGAPATPVRGSTIGLGVLGTPGSAGTPISLASSSPAGSLPSVTPPSALAKNQAKKRSHSDMWAMAAAAAREAAAKRQQEGPPGSIVINQQINQQVQQNSFGSAGETGEAGGEGEGEASA